MKLLLVLGFIVVGANANIISYSSGSCRNRCGEDSDYTCSCAARCSLFIQSTGCCDDYSAYCGVGVGYPIPSSDPTYFPTYHSPETPEHPTYYPPATEAPTYYPPQRCNNPGPIENGYISSNQHFFNIGDTVNYACKTGYQLKPAESRQRVCTSSYFISFLQTPYWTPEEPVCEKINPCHGNRCHVQHGSCIGNPGGFGYDCICNPGYTGNGYDCKQIFPCDQNPSPCDPNAMCTNVDESRFTCKCMPGYSGDGKFCIKPCANHKCHAKATCNPHDDGTYSCNCKDGYEGTGKVCTLIDPCRNYNCPYHSKCHNINGFPICKCNFGYMRGNGGKCIKTCPAPSFPAHGSYSPSGQTRFLAGRRITYTCFFGYKLEGSKIRKCLLSGGFSGFTSCKKILPCEKNPCDTNADCTNIGTDHFTCDCKDGYTGDGKTCSQIFPCDSMPCDPNANCTNIGTTHFQCDCLPGYTGTGKKCTQVFPCDSMPCDPNAMCTNIGTTHFQCDCLPGYTGTGKECTKINPCDLVDCPPHSTCHNIEDVAVCRCDEEYFQVPGGECLITCPAPELPEHGSYSPAEQSRYILGSNITYTCDIGYKLVGDKMRQCMSSGEFSGFARCREINPCQDYTPCDPNAICTNIDNLRYTCDCKDGYVGDGKKCRKLRPCEHKPCHANATCKDVNDRLYTCDCIPGYKGNGLECIRIFPCETNPCHSMADCIDVSYTKYTCNCVQGYRGSGKFCEKIDPCKNHQCSLCGTCIPNADGLGHTCVCNSGYFGDGKSCKKPCDEHNCHHLATCYPHECGNYSCECNVGYEGSGSFCRPIDPCRLVKCTDHSTCKVISDAPKCICDSGYRPLPGGRCQKIYPCDSKPCGSHTNCINVDEDSFRCDCVQGYFPSGLHSCDTRDCPVPEFPANGQYGPIQRTYPVGSKITYTCADGYRVVGFETRECLGSLRFSGFAICEPIPTTPPPPSCKGKCGAYSFGSACACDPACINHGNCCHDYAQYCSAYVGR